MSGIEQFESVKVVTLEKLREEESLLLEELTRLARAKGQYPNHTDLWEENIKEVTEKLEANLKAQIEFILRTQHEEGQMLRQGNIEGLS